MKGNIGHLLIDWKVIVTTPGLEWFDIKSSRTEMEEMSFPTLGWSLKKSILIIKEVPILKCPDHRITWWGSDSKDMSRYYYLHEVLILKSVHHRITRWSSDSDEISRYSVEHIQSNKKRTPKRSLHLITNNKQSIRLTIWADKGTLFSCFGLSCAKIVNLPRMGNGQWERGREM